jgi:Na+-translocating ferredoxin:NAD+ oxidoreductase subunit B
MLWTILILTAVGLICAVLITLTYRFLPKEPQSLKKAEAINENLPGMNCGACGYPGCFAYAQALSNDKKVFFSNTCATVLQDERMLSGLENALDIKVDKTALNKKAVVACSGNCGNVGSYTGVESCKTASKLLSGFKRCPYSCLGLGDCIKVCPSNAIRINIRTKVAVVDPDRCTGCGLCVAECPRNIISLVPADTKVVFLCSYKDIRDIPGREKCESGCIGCRKCYKACPNEAIIWNRETAMPEFDQGKCTGCGECIAACPHGKIVLLSEVAKKIKE